MKSLRNALLMIGSLAALSGCTLYDSHSEVKALNEAQAVGSPFTKYLADEYRTFANKELKQGFDYPDSLHFARKGLAAASGEEVMPEPIADWNLSPEHMEELATARGRLVAAFDLGAREIAPQQSAVAQARFDCWIEEQEENWENVDLIACRNEFASAMADLERMVQPMPVIEEPMIPAPIEHIAPPELSEPMKPEDAMYLVFFDFDSSTVDTGGRNVLQAVTEEITSRDLTQINVIGHTDSAGPQSYNNRLALKRANSVRDALIELGVDPALINVEGRGENELLVQTEDDVREPANRRAQITFGGEMEGM